MTDTHRHPDDDFSDIEAVLKSSRPRAATPGFADRIAVEPLLRTVSPVPPGEDFADCATAESALSAVTPAAMPAGFADRVAAASGNTIRIIPFVRRVAPFAVAAALAVAFLPAAFRGKSAPTGQFAETAPAPAETAAPAIAAANPDYAPGFPEEALHLPVVNLPDGRAYRPVLRSRGAGPAGFRAAAGGLVMPVALPADREIECQPVVFE